MSSLANLSKYLGKYNEWKAIVQKYQLSWSTGTEKFNQSWIESMITGEQQLPALLETLKAYCDKLPKQYCNALLVMTMNGLRVEESYESQKLLHSDQREQYVMQKGSLYLLQNFRYPQTFIRRTKKSFLSILPEPAYRLALATAPVTRNSLRLAQQHRKLPAFSKNSRKIFGTVLRQAGLDSELIDALSGRVPVGVFQRHYLRSGLPYDRIEKALNMLWQEVQPLVK